MSVGPTTAPVYGPYLPGHEPPRQPPRYSEQQAAADARTLWQATEGGLFGWGTDEGAIWNVLDGKTPDEIAMLSRAFKENYQRDLPRVLEDELGGAELDRARTLMQGSAHQAEADAIVVQDELDDTFVDEQQVLSLLESRQGAGRDQVALAYAARNGGPADARGAKTFLLDRMEKGGAFSGDDMARARALLLPEGGTAAGEARAAAAKAKVAMDGMGTDEQTLEDLFAGKTPEQISAIAAAYHKAYGQQLRARLNDELGGTDREQIFHLLDPADAADPAARTQWTATEDAMQLHAAIDGMGTDEQALRDTLTGKTPTEVAAIATAYKQRYGVELRAALKGDLNQGETSEILHLLDVPEANSAGAAQWQAEQDAHRLHAAVDGVGTDEATVRQILSGRNKSQIDAIALAYRSHHGEDLRQVLADDLDGREEFELLNQLYDRGAIDFRSNPQAAIAEQIRRGREMQAFEGGGGSAVDFGQQLFRGDFGFETDGARLTRTLDQAEQALRAGDLATAARYAGFSEENVRTLVETKNQASDVAATGAAVVAATVVTVATAGTASPLMVVALSAAASGAASGLTHATLNPQAGGDEITRQVAIATASGATGAVPIGRGGSLAVSLADDPARIAVSGGVRRMASDGAWVGGQSGLADGVVRTSTASDTWKHGFAQGLGKVALNGVISAGGGVASGAATGALMSPLMRFHPAPDAPTLPRLTQDSTPMPNAASGSQPGFLSQVGLPPNEGDSGGVAAMIKKFASRDGLREFTQAVSSTPRVKRHNTSSWITSRIDAGDYTRLQVPIRNIRSQHSVDGTAVENTARRAARIEGWLLQNPNATTMDMHTLDTLAGSTGSIQVGWHSGERFITLDGVGRVEAIREALRSYRAAQGVDHPLATVETYAVRLTNSEYSQLYKTSTYFRDAAGTQRDVPRHDLLPFSAVPRFVLGTAMNLAKKTARTIAHHLPIGGGQPDRRLPADLLPLPRNDGPGFQPPSNAGR